MSGPNEDVLDDQQIPKGKEKELRVKNPTTAGADQKKKKKVNKSSLLPRLPLVFSQKPCVPSILKELLSRLAISRSTSKEHAVILDLRKKKKKEFHSPKF